MKTTDSGVIGLAGGIVMGEGVMGEEKHRLRSPLTLRLVDAVDADALQDLSLHKMADANLGHDRYCHGSHYLFDALQGGGAGGSRGERQSLVQ